MTLEVLDTLGGRKAVSQAADVFVVVKLMGRGRGGGASCRADADLAKKRKFGRPRGQREVLGRKGGRGVTRGSWRYHQEQTPEPACLRQRGTAGWALQRQRHGADAGRGAGTDVRRDGRRHQTEGEAAGDHGRGLEARGGG